MHVCRYIRVYIGWKTKDKALKYVCKYFVQFVFYTRKSYKTTAQDAVKDRVCIHIDITHLHRVYPVFFVLVLLYISIPRLLVLLRIQIYLLYLFYMFLFCGCLRYRLQSSLGHSTDYGVECRILINLLYCGKCALSRISLNGE